MHAQANVNPTLPVKEWPLEALAAKLKQYCTLMTDLTPELLQSEAGGDYEALRAYLRRRGVEAYWKKARPSTLASSSCAWRSWPRRGACAGCMQRRWRCALWRSKAHPSPCPWWCCLEALCPAGSGLAAWDGSLMRCPACTGGAD